MKMSKEKAMSLIVSELQSFNPKATAQEIDTTASVIVEVTAAFLLSTLKGDEDINLQ